MMNSTADYLTSDTQNDVHSVTNKPQTDSLDQTLTTMNFDDVSEDRKPILSLLPNMSESMAQLNDVSQSNSPNATPDNKDWFLYRPRTRSAKKKLSFTELIVISSDSEGSDVECTRNPFVMAIVPKKEMISDVSLLEEAAVYCVSVTDISGLREQQTIVNVSQKHQPSVSPVKVLSAVVNTSSMAEMRQDPHVNCSDDNELSEPITDGTSQNDISSADLSIKDDYSEDVTEKPYDTDSSEAIVDESKPDIFAEIVRKKEIISDVSPMEEVAVSHTIVTDKTELHEEDAFATVVCVAVYQPASSPVKVPSAVNSDPLVEIRRDPQRSCSDYNDSSDDDSQTNQKMIPSAASDKEDVDNEAIKDNSCDIGSTETAIDGLDESKENISGQNIEPTVAKDESPELRVYGVSQTSRKDICCECSACKGENETSSDSDKDKTKSLIEAVSKLKPKCLQFERECTIVEPNVGKISSEPGDHSADTTKTSVSSPNDWEDSPAQRLEWSSDQDDFTVDEDVGNEKCGNSSDSDENMHEEEHTEREIRKDEYADDSARIGDATQHTNVTEISKEHNASDDELLDRFSQHSKRKSYFGSRSLSDDDFVTSGRYGENMTNGSVNFVIIIPRSNVSRMNSMDEQILRANGVPVPVPVLKNQDLCSSVSTELLNEDVSMEKPDADIDEHEREYGQRPPEEDDMLLIRIKRRWSAGNCPNLPEIPEKRRHIEEASTESDSDGKRIQTSKRTHRNPKKSSLKVVERMGGLFLRMSKNIREQGKKMKAKLWRKRKSLPKKQATTAGHFVVTPYREDKAVDSMKGFVIVPDGQENEDDK